MERISIKEAKDIFKKNFIGPTEFNTVSSVLKISKIVPDDNIPPIPNLKNKVKKLAQDHILILGIEKHSNGTSLSIKSLRDIFGIDSLKKEPCFYNQDWYINEKFYSSSLKNGWYLIKKTVDRKTRRRNPGAIANNLRGVEDFPPAILTAFTFFSYFLVNHGEKLWKNDFIWCSDLDSNGDRIYTGRYIDPKKKNKNGFNVHRYLSLRSCYGLAPMLKK